MKNKGIPVNKRIDFSASRLRELFAYDSYTGLFMRKVATNNKSKASVGIWAPGWINNSGYTNFRIDGVSWLAHRLAWLYVHNELPGGGLFIDHKNGVRNDNRISNLRLVTNSENQLNLAAINERSISKLRGAHWNDRLGKYQSEFQRDGKRVYIGLFELAEDAHKAYMIVKAANGAQSFR